MKPTALLLLAALALPHWWRESNSHAAGQRGGAAFARGEYATAEGEYGRAAAAAPSMLGAFNLGTAQMAAGHREKGEATLKKVEGDSDTDLRADALFNRGNGALAANDLDAAIGDYVEALKTKPDLVAAKRNLEIALARRQSQQRSSSKNRQNQKGPSEQKSQPSPRAGKSPKDQMDLDALLRSVQQQEEEELKRMRGRSAQGRVGW
jgi:tetratricopeptide (TPR) repeat protein